MEGVVVREIAQPYRWRSGQFCTLTVTKPVVRLSMKLRRRRGSGARCGGGSEWQDADEGHYLQAHVVEAVKMVSSRGQLFMALNDGREVEVNHVNPSKDHSLYKGSKPTMFLKMAADSELMLPIVVGETAVDMLMKGLHENTKMGMPNQYQILRNVVGVLTYEAKMVRVTERVLDTYYARIYIGKPGDEELLSVDARPSDALNLAVRCKIPIYVNKSIIAADGVRPVYRPAHAEFMFGRSSQDAVLDSADVEPDIMAEEITLMRNMLVAVVEERYVDAARWRDELTKLRAMSEWQFRQIIS